MSQTPQINPLSGSPALAQASSDTAQLVTSLPPKEEGGQREWPLPPPSLGTWKTLGFQEEKQGEVTGSPDSLTHQPLPLVSPPASWKW